MTNEALREHVTNIGFNLTLSKSMINLLVLLHHHRGDANTIHEGGYRYHPVMRTWTATIRSLKERGLITHEIVRDAKGYNVNALFKPTRAGSLVISLLKEAGIYQERLEELQRSVESGIYQGRQFAIVPSLQAG